MKLARVAVGVVLVGLYGCGGSTASVQDSTVVGTAEKGEAWASNDSPSLFTSQLEMKFDALPLNGEAAVIPWAGNYWPVYEDSINLQWDGPNSDSAARKYEKAFGTAAGLADGGSAVENAVSRFHGIDAHTSQKACRQSSECDSKKGETCALRRGKTEGRCIPTWWGICHAWTPAAILIPEPKHPVVENGVTFKVQDLKALASLVHDRTSSKFVSMRCNAVESSSEIQFDKYGRPTGPNAACRDSNAGTYHVLLANYLGKLKQAFAEDRVFDAEVWNQPLRGFRVTNKKVVTATEANTLIGATVEGGVDTSFKGTVKKGAWVQEPAIAVTAGQPVKVLMSGSNDADLFVKFGAAPSASAYDCRPYESGSVEACSLTAPVGATQVFVGVQGYADSSDFSLTVTVGGATPKTYVFNANAKSFVYVETEVSYITESSASTDGNLAASINSYTGTDRYRYILELDADGKIIGGEWVGDSKKAHPDFLWLPTGVAGSSVAGGAIAYAKVKALLDRSVAPEGGAADAGTGGGSRTSTESGTVARAEWKQYGAYHLAAGATLTAVLSGNGDADLYVRKGAAPTVTAYDCRPYKTGSAETCSVTGPADVYVGVNGYAASSTFQLTVTWVDSGVGTVTPPPPPPATTGVLDTSGAVALHELKIFTVPLAAGQKVSVKTSAPNDVDLYVKLGVAPSTSAYDQVSDSSTGNEALTVTATLPTTLYVGVYGYQASTFSLNVSPTP